MTRKLPTMCSWIGCWSGVVESVGGWMCRRRLLLLALSTVLIAGCGLGPKGTVVSQDASAEPPVPSQPKTQPQHQYAVAQATTGKKTILLEVPTTPEGFSQGLMYRDSLKEGWGMGFPFKPTGPVSFWMKNCRMALDFVFIRDQRIIHLVENAPPCLKEPCPTYGADEPVTWVVELPAGNIEAFNLEVDQEFSIAYTHRPPVHYPAYPPYDQENSISGFDIETSQ